MNISNESEVDKHEHNTNGQFRVRNVSEINTEYTPKKRKLPIWLHSSPQQQETSCDNKRQRTEEVVSCSSINSTNNLHADDITNKTLDESNDVSKNTEKPIEDKSMENLEISNDRITSLINNNNVTNNDTNPTGTIETNISEVENSSTLPNVDQKPTNSNLVLPSPIKIEIKEENKEPVSSTASLINNNNVTNNDTNPTGTIETNISEVENSSTLPNVDQKPTNSNLVLPSPIKIEIKEENKEPVSSTASGTTLNVIPNIKQKIKEEPSSTTRESCKYGIRCYRRNPQHRAEEAHPGDTDYRRPNFPEPPKGTPDCPFGNLCYRRNPSHFRDFSHPPSTDFKKNWQNNQKRLRDRKTKVKKSDDNCDDDLDDNEYDLNDDFIDDGSDDEFVPSDDDDSDDDFE